MPDPWVEGMATAGPLGIVAGVLLLILCGVLWQLGRYVREDLRAHTIAAQAQTVALTAQGGTLERIEREVSTMNQNLTRLEGVMRGGK